MQWSPAYSVKNALLDQQHRRVIRIINHLQDVIARGARPEELESVLLELREHAESHFAAEEAAMARAGYPRLALHQQKHRAMRAEVERRLELARSEGIVPAELAVFVRDWLRKHICKTDRDYVTALQEAGLN